MVYLSDELKCDVSEHNHRGYGNNASDDDDSEAANAALVCGQVLEDHLASDFVVIRIHLSSFAE
jgi:hypothetical protein